MEWKLSKASPKQELDIIGIATISSAGAAALMMIVDLIVGAITKNVVAIIVLSALAIVFLGVAAVFASLYTRKVNKGVIKPLFETTSENLDKVSKNRYDLEPYSSDVPLGGFDALNDTITKINDKYNTITGTNLFAFEFKF